MISLKKIFEQVLKEKSFKPKKGDFDTDLRQNFFAGQANKGIPATKYTPHTRDNSTSVGSRISVTGTPGWSKPLADKEWDFPTGLDKADPVGMDDSKKDNIKIYKLEKENKEDDDIEEPAFMKEPPVGSPIPQTTGGGRNPDVGTRGFRRK